MVTIGRTSLAAILALAAALRLWRLDENGFGRMYYAAAVRSGLESWHNLFFNAFDPAGFVSLDKPPVAIWAQVLSAKLLGVNGLAMLLPQVVEGIATVLVVYLVVARSFGRAAGLVAALLLAITPGSVAVDRSNNTDSCLSLVLVAAAWVGMRAAETRRLALFIAAMALVGLGFNVKMGAALVLAPTLALIYFISERPLPLMRRFASQSAGGIALVCVALAWVTIYDLVPAANRPYAGSTQHNSMLELALVHNGLARFTAPKQAPSDPAAASGAGAAAEQSPTGDAAALYDASPTGVLRLFRPLQAGQIAWWLPLALAGIVIGWRGQGAGRDRAIQVSIWSGWLVSYWLVFTFAGGPFHTYYLSILAPPLAALAGIGLTRAWTHRSAAQCWAGLAVLIAATAGWQALIAAGQAGMHFALWTTWLTLFVAALSLASMAVLMMPAIPGVARNGAAAIAFLALLIMPVACALSVILIRPRVAAPVASLAAYQSPPIQLGAVGSARIAAAREKLVAFLNRERGTARFLVATPNSFAAAPLIVATGAPVMAMGGYLGADPILTRDDLADFVRKGELRFVMLGGFSLTRPTEKQTMLADWVRSRGKPVDPALWRIAPSVSRRGVRPAPGGGYLEPAELFDLRPVASERQD